MFSFLDAVSRVSVHFEVIITSRFAVRESDAHLHLSMVNLGEERFRILFALIRRNPEEPMTWAGVFQLLGEQGGSHSLPLVENEQGDVRLSVSAIMEMRTVDIGRNSFRLPSLQLSSYSTLEQTGNAVGTTSVEA